MQMNQSDRLVNNYIESRARVRLDLNLCFRGHV